MAQSGVPNPSPKPSPSEPYRITYAPHRHEAFGEREIEAVAECLRDGWLAGNGPRTREFEQRVATYFGKRHGIFVNSGSSALELVARVIGLKPGDRVVTPALTFNTSPAPFCRVPGVTIDFVDVQEGGLVPSVEAVMAAVGPHTRVILLPNLVGVKPDWPALRAELRARAREDILLVEDSADTMTCTPESDVSIASFYASHVCTAGGCGGVFMCNCPTLLRKAQIFTHWGRAAGATDTDDMRERFSERVDGIPFDHKFLYPELGFNLKASEMNAAFGLVQLDRLPEFLEKRKANIARYVERLTPLLGAGMLELARDHAATDWLAMPLMHADRAGLLAHLESSGVQTRVLFSGNITRHPAYRERYLKAFPGADRVMERGLLLGAHHGMTLADVDFVCDRIEEFVFASPKE